MKLDGKAGLKDTTDHGKTTEAEVSADSALAPTADLNELAELYRVDSPSPSETPVPVETGPAPATEPEIATLEADRPARFDETALDAPPKAIGESDLRPDISYDGLPSQATAEVGPSMSAQQLRERYDGAFRRNAAKESWAERGRQLKTRDWKREKYGTAAEAVEIDKEKADAHDRNAYQIERLDRQIADITRETKDKLDSIGRQQAYWQWVIEDRNPIKKMIALGKKYLPFLGPDEASLKVDEFVTQRQELLMAEAQKNTDLQSQIERVKLEIQAEQEATAGRIRAKYSRFREEAEETFVTDRNRLRERVSTKNQDSRLASERTAELLAEGRLSVAELARSTNSLVVHTVPLEGWGINNTGMNNTEINAEEVPVEEKIQIVTEKQPDLAVSIVAIGNPDVKHGTMYPFGLIVDGSMISSYGQDSSTIAVGDKRYRKYVAGDNGYTLQADPVAAYNKHAGEDPGSGRYNEAIVHKPNIKGIFIDGERLQPVIDTQTGEPYDYYKDTVMDYYLPGQEAQILAQYEGVMSIADVTTIKDDLPKRKVVAKSGPYAGQEAYRFKRTRSGEQKAIEFAQTNYPDLPIYIRRSDGVYDSNGQPVSAEEIYAQ